MPLCSCHIIDTRLLVYVQAHGMNIQEAKASSSACGGILKQ